ncbi:hypothetical protein F0U60_15185 [Archangium minus]|uniref:Tetratricopeptide repeat protein n=1 Tax=Archangium minus TaxID=83450 RepID=A0ABY9WNC7_9BACT|nr:hypothetical protein F0U60_15185 [Archangium minus]
MKCWNCGHELPAGAERCPVCKSVPAEIPRTTGARVTIDQRVGYVEKGKVTGLEVGHLQGSVMVVQGNVIQLNDPSPEVLERFAWMQHLPTEVKPRSSKGKGLSPIDEERLARVEEDMRSILDRVHAAEARGIQVERIQAGPVEVSRVELLVKQAILAKDEAWEMFFEHLSKQKDKIEQLKRRADVQGGRTEVDLADFMEGFDLEAYRSKSRARYREAEALLREANRLEPTNTEVLLHLAQVLEDLDEDSPEVVSLLTRVQRLLDPPRNDRDRFQLAQAQFLMATRGEWVDPDLVRSARGMFAQLGRSDWVHQCELLLTSRHTSRELPVFQPVGSWLIQSSTGRTLYVRLLAGGTMQGTYQAPPWNLQVGFSGHWAFEPRQQLLHLQGMVSGLPFIHRIQLQGMQAGNPYGIGSDGLTYRLTRLEQAGGLQPLSAL